jgi:hypothetical protein
MAKRGVGWLLCGKGRLFVGFVRLVSCLMYMFGVYIYLVLRAYI